MISKFIAIITTIGFLTACGASGEAQPDPDPVSNNLSSRVSISSAPSSNSSSALSQTSSATVTSISSSRTSSATSSSRSSMPSSRSSSVSTSRSSSSMSTSRSSSSSSISTQQATIQWSHPNQRENGDFLELNEIGGYEIRVFNPSNNSYTYHAIPGNDKISYILNNYLPSMTIEIAVYDTQGLYSQYVTVSN